MKSWYTRVNTEDKQGPITIIMFTNLDTADNICRQREEGDVPPAQTHQERKQKNKKYHSREGSGSGKELKIVNTTLVVNYCNR